MATNIMVTDRNSIAHKHGIPVLRNEDDIESWLFELSLWEDITDLPKAKRAPVIFMSLPEKMRKSCAAFTKDELKSDEGLTMLIDKLKSLYTADNETAMFIHYEKFEKFERTGSLTIIDYINEFERRYNKIKEFKMELPSEVLACKLLINAKLPSDKQLMARTTVGNLTYENMKKQLKAIHDISGNVLSNASSSGVRLDKSHGSDSPLPSILKNDTGKQVTIKSEPTVYMMDDFDDNSDEYYEETNRTYFNKSRPFSNYNARYSNSRGRFRGNRGRSSFRGNTQSNNTQGNSTQRKKTNPIDVRTGTPSTCGICKSIYHWHKECPENEECFLQLFTTEEIHTVYMENFVGETLNSVVLDSACTKTVCGENWLKCYLDTLPEDVSQSLKRESSSRRFQFGHGKPLQSKGVINLPAQIGKNKVNILTDIVDAELPMLLSKQSMKEAGTKLDFTNDTVKMFGTDIPLSFTSTGHYCIALTPKQEVINKANLSEESDRVFLAIKDLGAMNSTQKSKIAEKLHKQFGHPIDSSKLKKLVKDAKINDDELLRLIEKVTDGCDLCKRYGKKKSRPVVGFSLARDFNDFVSMDLKKVCGVWFLHVIDLATRFSQAKCVESKDKEEIADKFCTMWISLFGAPKQILSDNGGEFNNELALQLGELLGIRVNMTPAESPWSNGTVERHNCIIGNMVEKIVVDNQCSMDVALAWAVSAKNALHNVYGHSPNQLVFGRNPNLPSVLTDEPQALEGVTSSELLAQHLRV